MKITEQVFRGRAPRVSPRALSDGYSQVAESPRLLSGDLESWAERALEAELVKAPIINTIYRLASRTGDETPYWLHWTPDELAEGISNVDIALGPVPGDTQVATFFTGTTLGPRYTNKFLATDESNRGSADFGAYPYDSRPLGIAPPTQAPTVEQTIPPVIPGMESFSFDGSDISGWTIGEGQNNEFNDGLTQRTWRVDPAVGDPTPGFYSIVARSDRVMLQRDFRLDQAAAFTYTFDYYLNTVSPSGDFGGFTHRFLNTDAQGPSVFHKYDGTVVFVEGTGSQQTYSSTGLVPNQKYTMRVSAMLQDDGYHGVTIDWLIGTTVVFTLTGRAQQAGGNITFENTSRKSQQAPRVIWVDTLAGNIVQMDPANPLPVFTNYVYTYINSLGQESAPSPPSMTIMVDNGIINMVTIPEPPVGSDVVTVRLYRASNSITAAQYLFVSDVSPPYPAVYNDSAATVDIGPDVLETTNFDPPPDTLQGIIALPGGALCGFSGNELCFSEPSFPYAWPIRYRLTTDYRIIAIAAIDSTVVVFTEAFTYFAAGNAPGDYAMQKTSYPQSCVSKRGVAMLPAGILCPTPDGLYLFTGTGAPQNTTELLFAQREWRALNPASMIGVVHDDRYFGFYDATSIGGNKGALLLDFRQGGFGLIDLPDHATATYADPITDTLYFTSDDSYSLPVGHGSLSLLSWDRADTRRPYIWRSRLYLMPYPVSFQCAQIKAMDYDDLTFRVFCDGALLFEREITSIDEFVIPPMTGRQFELEISGTSRVYQCEIAETMDELA